jgi:cyanophycinase
MSDLLNNNPVPNGILLVVGGHEDKTGVNEKKVQEDDHNPLEILETFKNLIGDTDCRIEVVTTASAEAEESFEDYQKAFAKLGINQIGHIHHDRRSDALNDAELIERVNQANAVYFSGGDQLKLTSVYGGTDFLWTLKQRYTYNNLVLGGTSAGAMAFSTPMIYAGSKEVQQIAGKIKVTTGLEFLKDVCIDTHFVDRSRFIRMAQVVVTNPTCIGIGLEEDTALIVRNGTDAEVIGSGTIIVIEGFKITDSNILDYGQNKRISIQDLNVKLLSKGDFYTITKKSPL